jgi:sortase A
VKSPAFTVAKKADSQPENLKWNGTMDGILTIDKINLRLPILKGATTSNLKLSVASIIGTGKIGQPGNYCIAGHRSYAYGKNFNRLDELKPGDIIQITAADNQYQYTVTEKLYVKPTDVWVLSGNGTDKEISLITCDPMINPTQRLVVRAKSVQ